MIKRVLNSFAFRSAHLYQYFLKMLPKRTGLKNINSQYSLISLCGNKHADMLEECIYSIYRNWKEIPEITIYSDGTLDKEKLKNNLAKFAPNVKVLPFDPVIEVLSVNEKYRDLVEFSNKHVIGKKLAVIVKHAIHSPVIWCDADILWYQSLDLNICFPSTQQNKFFIKTTTDYQAAYSNNLVQLESLLKHSPFINTGLVLMSGDLYEVNGIEKLLSVAAENPDHFSEQTILAYALKATSNKTFNLEEIACFQSDTLSLGPTFKNKSWLARHYVGPVRHLFWRDAFFNKFNF